jgi:uncharacterized protein YgiM (DUF1202 family)
MKHTFLKSIQDIACTCVFLIASILISSAQAAVPSAPISTPPVYGTIHGTDVRVRSGPGKHYNVIARVDNGAKVAILKKQDNWLELRLHSGRTAWVGSSYIHIVSSAPKTASTPSHASTPISQSGITHPSSGSNPIKSSANTVKNNNNADKALLPAKTKPDIFAQTRPDGGDLSNQSSGSPVSDGFRMILYLIPVLILVIVVIRVLRYYYLHNGALPWSSRSVISSLKLFSIKPTAGHSIRVVESAPVGNITLHLVEVRGSLLLIGASPQGVTLLKEYHDLNDTSESFSSLLSSAEGDMNEPESALSEVIDSLDDSLRETQEQLSSLKASKNADEEKAR